MKTNTPMVRNIFWLILDHLKETKNVGETDWEQRNNFVEVGQFHEKNGFM